MERELESARGWAVHHEQAATEYGRRVAQALAYLEELDCGCEPDEFSSVKEAPCGRCDLEGILNGDVA